MRKASILAIAALLAGASSPIPVAAAATQQAAPGPDGPPDGQGSYDDLVTLFAAFTEWKTPTAVNGVVDYSPATVEKRRAELRAFQAKLHDFGVARWDRHRQVDYLAVRAQMDLMDFTLNVTKPWARDPGMYVDELQRLAYTDLPLKGDALTAFRARLRTIPAYLAQARVNLDSVAADYADLAIHSLSHGDGVGHGMPYRAVEPEGLIGWFADLRGRAATQQPALVGDIDAAQKAIAGFRDWLVASRPTMTAQAGVGKPAYDWFLKNVRLMPYDSDQIVTLAERELERHWANYTTERHRNRNLPELQLPGSAEEYEAQLAGTDAKIRKWLRDEEIISIPDYIPDSYQEVGFNAPWIVRPNGPMFWEQVQFRDASPDHLHATFPGHRFDGMTGKRVTHPIRRLVSDSGRTEGWGFYLEETALQLGLFDDRPRTRELIYIFGLFRAARTIGDVKMQRNEMSVEQTMNFWKEWTPYLDDNVARVDAGIYIRRPPGYGMTYTIGAMQLQKLLVDRKRQLGDKFSIRDYHDYLMNTGRLPVSLLRYDLTGHDDEIRQLWRHVPLSTLSGSAH
ncbi:MULTISPECIES: DUF885 family protein [Sphingopyxis]|uniref:DUF885 family protein n=1 Tax=Sphingopyxis TaxID=165697 RepID=UPI00086A74E5|nr:MULTISPECIES: DUF885 family protein [Sphingopyxis]APW71785.1 hypothetical protein BWD40_01880 [Sphingopyxis granuli]AVA12506.1 DUF885 domain-containing protein [Sphingopyxis sp. MG]ODU29747.1 MAG: hypothetical protein ABS88_07970 [Sphingopyxis sp. SCN 67-31]